MPQPAILAVTGASGVGKTTLVRALEGEAHSGVRCYYFDSIGVPRLDQMVATFGSPDAWQAAMTEQWVARLVMNADQAQVAVLDGQVRPSLLRAAFARHGVVSSEVLLIDCTHEIRDARLIARGHPELVSRDMAAWAAYLRGQADALRRPILDTTELTPAEAVTVLRDRVLDFRGRTDAADVTG